MDYRCSVLDSISLGISSARSFYQYGCTDALNYSYISDDAPCSSPRVILFWASPYPRALQVAAAGRSIPTDTNGSSDYLSGQSASSGFSASCESNGAGCSGDLSSEGDSNSNSLCNSNRNINGNGSSDGCNTGEGVSSSDYGGGASSGSLSGDGDSLDNDAKSTPRNTFVERGGQEDELRTGSSVQSRKRSRRVSPPDFVSAPFLPRFANPQSRGSVAQKAAPGGARRTTKGSQENDLNGGGESGGGDADGDQGGDPTVDERTSAGSSPTSRILPPTARRLAMSAKKTILLRHGFDSRNGARLDQEHE